MLIYRNGGGITCGEEEQEKAKKQEKALHYQGILAFLDLYFNYLVRNLDVHEYFA